ncbi:hypothetical protein [Lysobacter terrae]
MNFPDNTSPKVGSFVTALRELFEGDDWSQVKPFAQRAREDWGRTVTTWADIESRVRAEWNASHAERMSRKGDDT